MEISWTKDTSTIKFALRTDQFFSRDVSQIVECLRILQKIHESGPDAKFQNLVSFSLSEDIHLW